MQVANGGARTASGALAHFLAAYTPAELALARSDYLRAPPSPARPPPGAPRSALSLRAASEEPARLLRPPAHYAGYAGYGYTHSVHTLRRQGRARSPPSPPNFELSCDCLPVDPIPPPELFDF